MHNYVDIYQKIHIHPYLFSGADKNATMDKTLGRKRSRTTSKPVNTTQRAKTAAK